MRDSRESTTQNWREPKHANNPHPHDAFHLGCMAFEGGLQLLDALVSERVDILAQEAGIITARINRVTSDPPKAV